MMINGISFSYSSQTISDKFKDTSCEQHRRTIERLKSIINDHG